MASSVNDMVKADMATTWQVLSRSDCSLCEQMLTELVELLGEQATRVRVVDVEGDEVLERKYGQRVPVLLIDDEFVCAYRLDRGRVDAYLHPKNLST